MVLWMPTPLSPGSRGIAFYTINATTFKILTIYKEENTKHLYNPHFMVKTCLERCFEFIHYKSHISYSEN